MINVESLDHVTVNITDVERAKKFYGGLLGLEELPRPASFDFPGAWFRAGNALIHLVGRAQADAESSRHFALWVKDVKAAYATIEAAGFEAKWDKRKIPGIDRFFTRDPDGNRIELQGSDGTVWAA
jgi:glyoxylase I family protein